VIFFALLRILCLHVLYAQSVGGGHQAVKPHTAAGERRRGYLYACTQVEARRHAPACSPDVVASPRPSASAQLVSQAPL